MKIGALVFSRFDSSRLPGKALRLIAGRELLGRVLDRAASINGVDQVVVATSDRVIDDGIADFALSEGYNIYRGDACNVAKRALDACGSFGWDGFVRICGDRPFFLPAMADRAIARMLVEKNCLVTTNGDYQLPPGFTTEVLGYKALKDNLPFFSEYHQEHLTSFFYENPLCCNMAVEEYQNLSKNCYNTRLVVDNEEDLARAEWIVSQVDCAGGLEEYNAELILQLACKWDAENLPSTNEIII